MFIDDLIVSLVLFARHAVGTVTRPYETYRNIADHSRPLEAVAAAGSARPDVILMDIGLPDMTGIELLTRQFTLLALATAVTFILAIILLWGISRLLGGKGTLRAVALCWGYSLLPTLSWFLITSVLYVLIPPPRTERLQGVLFSIVYLVVSGTLFFWKATLAYLTLRFAMRLDLVRIVAVFALTVPVIGAYSVWMYRLGIFRIPFL